MSSPYIFDIIFIAVMALMFALGRKRGAVKVAAGLCGTLCAWLLASWLSPSLTPITVKLVTPYASSVVEKTSDSMGLTPVFETAVVIGDEMSQAAASLAGLGDKLAAVNMPEEMAQAAEKVGVTSSLEQVVDSAEGEVTPMELMTQAIVNKTAPMLTFLVIFAAVKLAISAAAKVLSLDWPILSSLNHMAGGLLGLLGGALIVLALCAGILAYGSPEPTGLTSAPLLSRSIIGGFISRLIK